MKLNLARLKDENQEKQLQHLKQQKELGLLLIEEQISLPVKNIANLSETHEQICPEHTSSLLAVKALLVMTFRLISVYWQRCIRKICM